MSTVALVPEFTSIHDKHHHLLISGRIGAELYVNASAFLAVLASVNDLFLRHLTVFLLLLLLPCRYHNLWPTLLFQSLTITNRSILYFTMSISTVPYLHFFKLSAALLHNIHSLLLPMAVQLLNLPHLAGRFVLNHLI